jgi:DNA helicase-2/ATP-dependent DNA helicase PcrA
LRPIPELNSAQRAAVEHETGPVLVVAGAGSGKTRVLTARVARLIERGVRPEAVVAFTFTNRAAREMRERIVRAVGEAAERLWIGTFHGTGLRILRREAGRVPGAWWPAGFSVYDREDQESVLRDVIRRLKLPDASFRVGDLLAKISDAKNALVSPEEAARVAVSPYERQVAECFGLYQETLRRQSALDFDDLIGETVRLLQHPEVVDRYAKRFEHVLVDEYQDTNHAQFCLVASLASGHGNVFVVGDDDQSIYGWRGADLAHVLDFEQKFPGATVVRLEQNYRSTGNILHAANAVIAHNRARQGKRLWCERENGPRLKFVLAADEVDEARRICGYLEERWRRRDARLSDCAVLYRTNAQSRALETELRHRGLRYEVVGGVAFYQRREVKDIMAYLRVVANPADRAAFWRVVNTPRRGLGEAVRARIEQRLMAGVADPVEALRALLQDGELGRAATGAAAFLEVIDDLRRHAVDPVDLLLRRCLERSGYLQAMVEDRAEAEAVDRRANLEELIASATQFEATGAELGLAAFLAEAALVADVDRLEEDADRVLLLTAHNAKGLEFAAVVIAGLEEGLMPHGSALESTQELEEERRLFYVALTRARDEVLLTAAALRRRFAAGTGPAAQGGQVSRFVDEIPEEILDREESLPASWSTTRIPGAWEGRQRSGAARRDGADASGPAYRTPASLAHTLGREVFHESFGRGVVIAAEGGGEDLKFTVRFGPRVRKVLGRFLTGGPDAH